MYLRKNFLFIFIFIINISHIYSIKFTTYKIKSDDNNKFSKKDMRSLLYVNKNFTLKANGYIPLFSSGEGLYTFNLNIGNPSQQFNLLLDTGSALLWINNKTCIGCLSGNKFNPLQSQTFKPSQELININYLSGEISGIICQETIKFFLESFIIPYFNFILVNQSNIDFNLDGIFGLSKGVRNIHNLKYSALNQIYENEILEENIFFFDFSRNIFYMGEMPLYINKYNNFTCKSINGYKFNNYYWHCNYDKIKFNKNQLLSNENEDNYIIFDSGTNCLIFPYKYISLFYKIISENRLLSKSKCLVKINDTDNNLYTLICEDFNNLINQKNDEYKNFYLKEEFITFYLHFERKIYLTLNDIYDKEHSYFKIYFTVTPNNAIILGVPFFEKYPILFNKDNGNIVIYDEIKRKENSSILMTLFATIFILIIIILVFLLIYNIIMRKKKKITSTQIEKQFSNYGLFDQEVKI